MSSPEPSLPSLPLAGYLQQQQSEGTADSEGVFTIDLKVAKRKLAAFQLPTTESWILVLVQAAHRGGATDIKVTQLARQSIIQISGAQKWSWSALTAVLDGESTTDGALLAYAVVVRALSGDERLTSFRVKTPDGISAVWRRGAFKLEQDRIEDVLLKNQVVFEVSHLGEFPEKRSPFFELRRCAREQLVALRQALVESCFASGIPLVVDGLSIPGLHLGEPLEPHHRRVPMALLAIEDYRIPSVPFSAALDSAQEELSSQAEISASSRELDDEAVLSGLACLSVIQKTEKGWFRSKSSGLADTPAHSRLLWIQDGVVVSSQRLDVPGNLELTLVVSAAGLKTDLTGLELVRGPELLERKRTVVKLASEELLKLSQSCQEDDQDFFALSELQQGGRFSRTSWFGKWAASAQREPLVEQREALTRDLELMPQRLLKSIGIEAST